MKLKRNIHVIEKEKSAHDNCNIFLYSSFNLLSDLRSTIPLKMSNHQIISGLTVLEHLDWNHCSLIKWRLHGQDLVTWFYFLDEFPSLWRVIFCLKYFARSEMKAQVPWINALSCWPQLGNSSGSMTVLILPAAIVQEVLNLKTPELHFVSEFTTWLKAFLNSTSCFFAKINRLILACDCGGLSSAQASV